MNHDTHLSDTFVHSCILFACSRWHSRITTMLWWLQARCSSTARASTHAQYSSCAEHPIQHFFLAIATSQNHKLYGGASRKRRIYDRPWPNSPTFVTIVWTVHYRLLAGINEPCTKLLIERKFFPWSVLSKDILDLEDYGNSIPIEFLLSELTFKDTTHDQNIYRAIFQGHLVFILRQANDFALQSSHANTKRRQRQSARSSMKNYISQMNQLNLSQVPTDHGEFMENCRKPSLWSIPSTNSIVVRFLDDLPLVRPSPKNEIMPP